MMMYRFVTEHRTGKWYSDLSTAQEQACAIGAGFLEPRSGEFYQYPETRLEMRRRSDIAADDLCADLTDA